MLPTKGYFQDIDCPYYDSSCGRPYCHFRHKKKQQESGNDSPKESEIPTYNPTPKSQLANNRSHIPISYVPDLAFRPERTVRNVQKFVNDKPTYKPTPLSILSSGNKLENGAPPDTVSNDSKETNVIKENIIDVNIDCPDSEYCPSSGHEISVNYTPTDLSKQLENESVHEYKPEGENSNFEYKPTSSSDNNVDTRTDMHYSPLDSNDTAVEYHPTKQTGKQYESTIDFEELDNEFDMIDEIISDSKENSLNDNEKIDAEYKLSVDDNTIESDQTSKDVSNIGICDIATEKKVSKCGHVSKHSDKLDSKKTKPDKDKQRRKSHERNSHESKHRSTEHKKRKSTEKVDKTKSKKHDSSKSVHHTERSSEKSDKSISKQKHSSKNPIDGQRSEKKRSTNSSRDSSCRKEKHKSHDRDSEKAKSKHKKHSVKESERRHDHRKSSPRSKEHKSSSDKSSKIKRNISSERNEVCKKKRKSESEDSDIYKETIKSHKSKLTSNSESDDSNNGIPLQNTKIEVDDIDFQIDSEDDETMQECYRIFNEYQPPKNETKSPLLDNSTQKQQVDDDLFVGKKRVAHINAEKPSSFKFNPPPANPVPNAAQVMTNRFKVARAAQASNEQNNIMTEVKNSSSKRSHPPSLMAAMKNYKMQRTIKDAQLQKTASTSSLVDDILSGTQKTCNAIAKFGQRRIAPVSNVYSMQKAKERIEEMKQKATELNTKTPAQIVKGSKRVAHVPEFSLSDIPDVLQADKSKLPVNVRTRFLTMIAEECGKLYLTREDAYTRALNEEFSCYEKCKALITYKNSAMLAVNRIRKEHQERSKQGLGPIYAGEDNVKDKSSELEGRRFYAHVKKYLLTDEELDIHGYPKESKIPGRAIIKNRKQVPSMHLEEHQRKCARCSKIYLVDEDGFAFYDEECLYHPLKKRTLRGEQTYLCCKSNDDAGCSTSHTHVSDCIDDSELEGYQTTMEPESDSDKRSQAVYALDCEMCYTTKGLELTRVTIVDSECKTVYDTLVKPLNPIIDYNTRFSGITKEQMDRTSTNILQVQANILHLCNAETILVGHSLESDMKALKIIHGSIIDTAVLFPHRLGLPHKRALRALASEYLKKIIQNDISGHDSAEDSITCMELIKWKLKEELKVRGIK